MEKDVYKISLPSTWGYISTHFLLKTFDLKTSWCLGGFNDICERACTWIIYLNVQFGSLGFSALFNNLVSRIKN